MSPRKLLNVLENIVKPLSYSVVLFEQSRRSSCLILEILRSPEIWMVERTFVIINHIPQFTDISWYILRRISCHGRNHSQASCEYSLTIFLCCQHHSEYSLLGSKFSTNLLFAASKCHVTIQQRGSSRCSKWPNRMGSLQW